MRPTSPMNPMSNAAGFDRGNTSKSPAQRSARVPRCVGRYTSRRKRCIGNRRHAARRNGAWNFCPSSISAVPTPCCCGCSTMPRCTKAVPLKGLCSSMIGWHLRIWRRTPLRIIPSNAFGSGAKRRSMGPRRLHDHRGDPQGAPDCLALQ